MRSITATSPKPALPVLLQQLSSYLISWVPGPSGYLAFYGARTGNKARFYFAPSELAALHPKLPDRLTQQCAERVYVSADMLRCVLADLFGPALLPEQEKLPGQQWWLGYVHNVHAFSDDAVLLTASIYRRKPLPQSRLQRWLRLAPHHMIVETKLTVVDVTAPWFDLHFPEGRTRHTALCLLAESVNAADLQRLCPPAWLTEVSTPQQELTARYPQWQTHVELGQALGLSLEEQHAFVRQQHATPQQHIVLPTLTPTGVNLD